MSHRRRPTLAAPGNMPVAHLEEVLNRMEEDQKRFKELDRPGVFTSYSMHDTYRTIVLELYLRKLEEQLDTQCRTSEAAEQRAVANSSLLNPLAHSVTLR